MLTGKNAIVTGSTSGIGEAIARSLAAEGCNIMLNGFGEAAQIETLRKEIETTHKVKVLYNGADMSKGDQVAKLVTDTEAQLGNVDILVNNAGIQHVAPIEDFPVEKWDAIIAINLSAAFHAMRAAVPGMKKRGWGRIINIASAHGLVASAQKAAYVAAKHGVLGLTKTVALEVANNGITCNAICPGWVYTPLVDKQIKDNAAKAGISEQQAKSNMLSEKQALHEFTKPEQIGALAVFLCGDAAATITGVPLSVDGGWDRAVSDKIRKQAARSGKPLQGCKPINLALQGGGSHGAFTWGVIDQMLLDKRVSIHAISATSAGAMNAVVTADGLLKGGTEFARQHLKEFWQRVSLASMQIMPFQQTMFDKWMGHVSRSLSPISVAMDTISRMLSPYQFNVFDINPLRDILADMVDFEAIRSNTDIRVFINATHVKTGKPRIFSTEELTLDMVMASACLPMIYKTVFVNGEPYWDGGYSGNPAIYPLIYRASVLDVLIVQVNPLVIRDVPVTATDIIDRVNEISFNSSLMDEMRAVEFVARLIDDGKLKSSDYKRMRMHMIEAGDIMSGLGQASKINADWEFITHLHDVGVQSACDFLDAHYDAIGNESTLDIRDVFL